jgi:NAD(P)-dependent dehydrogenase (short-subunit alcohol dehydrogenase family)
MEAKPLDGTVALVTGGARGIGRAISQGLHEAGAAVVIADLDGADMAAAELSRAAGVVADVATEAGAQSAVDAAVERYGGLDILVNNAGLYATLALQPFEQIAVEEWRRVMDVNVLSMFLCARAATPRMRARGGGRIINISSGTPFRGVPMLLHYVTSKGAIVAFTRALAKELGDELILVNCVAPGFTISDGVRENPAHLETLREITIAARTIKRDQHPEDIVGAVVFLCGPDAGFVTGQTMVIDGGQYFH